MKSGHLSRYDGHLGKLNWVGSIVRTLLKVRREAKRALLVGTVILDRSPKKISFSKSV